MCARNAVTSSSDQTWAAQINTTQPQRDEDQVIRDASAFLPSRMVFESMASLDGACRGRTGPAVFLCAAVRSRRVDAPLAPMRRRSLHSPKSPHSPVPRSHQKAHRSVPEGLEQWPSGGGGLLPLMYGGEGGAVGAESCCGCGRKGAESLMFMSPSPSFLIWCPPKQGPNGSARQTEACDVAVFLYAACSCFHGN